MYDPKMHSGEEYNKARGKLAEYGNAAKLILSDVDGTLVPIKGSTQSDFEPIGNLVARVAERNLRIGFISARNSSLRIILLPIVEDQAKKTRQVLSFYHAGGNGASLCFFTCYPDKKTHQDTLYEQEMPERMAQQVYSAYESLKLRDDEIDPVAKKTFMDFLQKDWHGLLQKKDIAFMGQMPGRVFRESVKVGLAMPENEVKRRNCVAKLREELEPVGLHVSHSGTPFADISMQSTTGEDGKVYAAKVIMNHVGATKETTCYFGDAPKKGDNDAALLRYMTYGFTNNPDFTKENQEDSPYLLPPSENSIDTVYDALGVIINPEISQLRSG